jgi:hypothetical protein
MTPEICPNCGAEVPPKAKACPECGACDETGWSEGAEAQSADLGIPEESFNYDDFVQREFGAKKVLPYGVGWFLWIVSLVVVGTLVWLFLR